MDPATAAALVGEGMKRAGLIWVRRHGATTPAQSVWHVWQDESAYLLTGGIEQPLPDGMLDPGAVAEVIVPSKDKGSRLVAWLATVTVVPPDGDEWAAVVPALQAKRLNSPDGDAAPRRWAADCSLLRLTPTG